MVAHTSSSSRSNRKLFFPLYLYNDMLQEAVVYMYISLSSLMYNNNSQLFYEVKQYELSNMFWISN